MDFAKRGNEKGRAKPCIEEASPESLELLSRLVAMNPLPEAENALSAFSPELEGMLRAAAAYITFASYDVWFAYCAAFKRLAASDPAWGDKPFEIFHEISERSPRYESREDCQHKWEQFDENAPRDNPKTYRSLLFDAKAAGWVPEQDHWAAIAQITGKGDVVDRLNVEVAWIRAYQKVYHLAREKYYHTRADFENDHNRFREYENSDGKVKPTTEGKWWFMNHDRRRTYENIVFEPGLPEVVSGCLNIWRPPALVPVEGDVGPFLEVLENVVRDPVERKILLQLLAHVFQRPRERVNWAVILHGAQTGVGKSTLLEFIRSLLGPYAASIGPAELESPFKGYMRQKLFLIAEETNIGHKREFANGFKNNITNDEIFINEKYQPAERFKNYIRWVFLSNDDASIHLDPTDRRYFVIRSGSRKLNTKTHKEWFNSGGNAAVLHHLLNVDLSSFNYPEAPMTSAKADMIDHGRSACELFADRVTDEIVALKETAGDRPMRTIYSISEIKTKFAGGDLRISEMSDNVLSRAFGKLGISSRRFRGSGGRKTYLMFDDCQDWAHTETPAWSEREKERAERATSCGWGDCNLGLHVAVPQSRLQNLIWTPNRTFFPSIFRLLVEPVPMSQYFFE